jgi:hypothetical protein
MREHVAERSAELFRHASDESLPSDRVPTAVDSIVAEIESERTGTKALLERRLMAPRTALGS